MLVHAVHRSTAEFGERVSCGSHVCGPMQADNVIVKTVGELREEDGLRNHVDLVMMLDIVDLENGTTVAGGTAC